MTHSVSIAVVEGKTITQTLTLPSAKNAAPLKLKALKDGKFILAEGDSGLAPQNFTVRRVGKDLHLNLEGTDPAHPQVIIEGF
jgi:hypothetical protein